MKKFVLILYWHKALLWCLPFSLFVIWIPISVHNLVYINVHKVVANLSLLFGLNYL